MNLLGRITDILGGYTRIACPHCPLHLRYRGVSPAEEKRLRTHMADHIASHQH